MAGCELTFELLRGNCWDGDTEALLPGIGNESLASQKANESKAELAS
jgi:hypothetical protein